MKRQGRLLNKVGQKIVARSDRLGRISDDIVRAYALPMSPTKLWYALMMTEVERQFRIFLLDLVCSSTTRRMRGDMWHDMMDVHDMPAPPLDHRRSCRPQTQKPRQDSYLEQRLEWDAKMLVASSVLPLFIGKKDSEQNHFFHLS